MKWIALALIVGGLWLAVPAKFGGEFGPSLRWQAGALCFAIGACWIGVLIFIHL